MGPVPYCFTTHKESNLHVTRVDLRHKHQFFFEIAMWLVLVYTIYMKLKSNDILDALNATAEHMEWNGDPVEILLIGGAGAMLTGMLRSERVTQDCDVIDYQPQDGQQAVLAAAAKVAAKKGLPEKWLNSKAMGLDIL